MRYLGGVFGLRCQSHVQESTVVVGKTGDNHMEKVYDLLHALAIAQLPATLPACCSAISVAMLTAKAM